MTLILVLGWVVVELCGVGIKVCRAFGFYWDWVWIIVGEITNWTLRESTLGLHSEEYFIKDRSCR